MSDREPVKWYGAVLRQVRREALEEAALTCEGYASGGYTTGQSDQQVARSLARTIRALADAPEEST